jgi:DNA invertase Pin-like site-specific DNA recombinase
MISERTRAGLAVVKQRGGKLGNPNPMAALVAARGAVQIRKAAFSAAALKTIQEIQSAGVAKVTKIADCMNKRGEKTSRAGKWTATAVRRVLCAVQQKDT